MELMGFSPVFLMGFPVEPSTNGQLTGLYVLNGILSDFMVESGGFSVKHGD